MFDSNARGGAGLLSKESDLKRILDDAEGCRYFVAGGLNEKNVQRVISITHPYAVDVQSGVAYQDNQHVKDPEKVKAFIRVVCENQK